MGNKLGGYVLRFLSLFREYGFTAILLNLLMIFRKISALRGVCATAKHSVILRFIQNKYANFLNIDANEIDRIDWNSNGYTIWICWWDGREGMPDLVKECFASVAHHAENHPVVLLTKNNYEEYIAIQPEIIERVNDGKISLAYLSDIIRMSVLAKFGGLWLDATIFVSGRLPDISDDRILSLRHSASLYVSKGRWTGFCIGGSPNQLLFKLVRDLLIEHRLKYNNLLDYFLIDYFIAFAINNYPEIDKAMTRGECDCPSIYTIQEMRNECISEEQWNSLRRGILFSKLCWRDQYHDSRDGRQTVFGRMKSGGKDHE